MNLYLAPLQDMTTAYQRKIYADIFGGIDIYYAPFIAVTHMRKSRSTIFEDVLPANNDGIHLVPQLLGNNADDFKFFAKNIAAMGYEQINWNIGCPFPTVTKKKKGSGLMPYPYMIRDFLDQVCEDSSYRLTVKMRLGLNSAEEGLLITELLNDYPLDAIIIHSRLGIQKYSGQVDLDAFEMMHNISKHKVVYNGDIFSMDDYLRLRARFPELEDVMLGRGALRDPFLPSAIKGQTLSAAEKSKKLKSYHDAIFDYNKNIISDERILLNQMKEFWAYTASSPEDTDLLQRIRRCDTIAEYFLTLPYPPFS